VGIPAGRRVHSCSRQPKWLVRVDGLQQRLIPQACVALRTASVGSQASKGAAHGVAVTVGLFFISLVIGMF
jgi:hypothetical protein